jgi:hypothetical protein
VSSPRVRALGALCVTLASSALSARDAAAQAEPAPVVVAATPAGPLPTQAPAPSAAEDDPAALLAQLDAELEHSDPAAVGTMPNLTLYGFADVGFYKYFLPAGNPLSAILYPNSAFAVGNLNLYLSSELGSNWRSLVEVRFSYLPNGARRVVGSEVERTDTTAADYTSFSRRLQTGSILLQRAWIEYAHDPLFILRLGSWLTPYGIWNEDHGSPTIIPVTRPYVIGLELLPERQTGLLVYGTTYASQSLTLGYTLGLSNGRGPVQDYADLDENKALTLRLHGIHRAAGVFSFGGALYYGRYTNNAESIVLDGESPRLQTLLTEQYDELSVALDARYVLGGLHAQAELIWTETAYTLGGRPVRLGAELQADHRNYGGYMLLGYRFEWLGLMPYGMAEYTSLFNIFEPNRAATNDAITDYSLGINSRPVTNVTLKLEGNFGVFYVDDPRGSAFGDLLWGLQAQVAWAF